MLRWAVNCASGPVAIRYPRGGDRGYAVSAWSEEEQNHPVECCRAGNDITIVTYGAITDNVMEAAKLLSAKGVDVNVLRLLSVSPLLDSSVLSEHFRGKNVIVVEETMESSGIGGEIATLLPNHRVTRMNLGDKFVTHGDINSLYKHCGLDAHSITERTLEVLKNEN